MAEMQQVARLAEIAENRPFGVMLGDDSFVLIRNGSEVRAFSGKCPHAGAPLAEGAICIPDRSLDNDRGAPSGECCWNAFVSCA